MKQQQNSATFLRFPLQASSSTTMKNMTATTSSKMSFWKTFCQAIFMSRRASCTLTPMSTVWYCWCGSFPPTTSLHLTSSRTSFLTNRRILFSTSVKRTSCWSRKSRAASTARTSKSWRVRLWTRWAASFIPA